jgi:hypothetical protein
MGVGGAKRRERCRSENGKGGMLRKIRSRGGGKGEVREWNRSYLGDGLRYC